MRNPVNQIPLLSGPALSGIDPYAMIVAAVDNLLMLLYVQARRNASRITRLLVAFLPLMLLLVGSCKTSFLPASFGETGAVGQFRAALFPDRASAQAENYYPAAGYISRAQKYVADAPAALVHLTEQEVGYLFGAPALERRDADARIWQYKTEACVVDFYFYGNDASDGSPVSYVDFRPAVADLQELGDADSVSPRHQSRCLRKMASHAGHGGRG